MTTGDETHLYHIGGPLRRNIAWLIFGPFAGLMAATGAASSKSGDQAAGWFIAGFLVLIGMGVHWLVSRARLEVSATGVRLRQPGYTLETPWSNVESLRMDKGAEGFVTKEPMQSQGAARLSAMRGAAFGMGRMPLYDRTARQLLYEQRYIPIEAFAWHVRHGRLADDLQRLAPHLQTTTEAARPKPKPTPEQQRQNRRAVIFIFGGTAVVLTVALLLPPSAVPHIIPGAWAFLAGAIAFQCAWSTRIAIRTGAKWAALFYALFAILIGLWCLALVGQTITGKTPPKHENRSNRDPKTSEAKRK